MKKVLLFLVIFFLLSIFSFAQNPTIILVRHAEKDISPTADKRNPDLTAEGRQRAERLVEAVRKCKPKQVFSTDTKRTRQTATPVSQNSYAAYAMQIQIYDFSKMEQFAERLRGMNGCVVVVGHSNTVPALANMLLKTDKYKDLPDSEYSKLFILKVGRKKVKDTVITY
jgi:broad specificity phosphatase PhoE